MKPDAPLVGPLLKAERSKSQIEEINKVIGSFVDRRPYKIVSEYYPDADEEVWRFQLTEMPPPQLSIIVGEVFHNLRSALDNMLAEIVVKIEKRSDTKVEFPFGLGPDEFETALGKQKKLPTAAIPLIRALKPYRGGDPLLWMLHEGNRRDKHRFGLVPVNLRTSGKVSYLSFWYGAGLMVGSKSGQRLGNSTRFSDTDYVRLAIKGQVWGCYGLSPMDLKTGLPIVAATSHLSFENLGVGPAKDTMEFFTATPGTKFKTDFEPSLQIAFENATGFEREPIVHVLTQLRDLVEGILLTFRDRFF